MADVFAFWAKSQADKRISELPNGFISRGEVATYFDLPASGNKVGDLYTVQYASGGHIAGRYAWGVSGGALKWYYTDGDNDFVSQSELEAELSDKVPSVNPVSGQSLSHPIYVATNSYSGIYGKVGEKDKYGNAITPITVQKTEQTTTQHPNIVYEDFGVIAQGLGFCQNLGRERVPKTGGSYIPTKLYIDNSYTPSKSELAKIEYDSTGVEGLDIGRLTYFEYYDSSLSDYVEKLFIGVAREIYTYDTKPTLQNAISDLCFYYNESSEKLEITSITTAEEYAEIDTVYTYAYAVAVFPNCDGDFTNMTPVYCTNPFDFGGSITPTGWQTFSSPFTLTATGVPTDSLCLFCTIEDGNGTWYYFAEPKTYLRYKHGTTDLTAGGYLETGTIYFYENNNVITKIYIGVNNVAKLVSLS